MRFKVFIDDKILVTQPDTEFKAIIENGDTLISSSDGLFTKEFKSTHSKTQKEVIETAKKYIKKSILLYIASKRGLPYSVYDPVINKTNIIVQSTWGTVLEYDLYEMFFKEEVENKR